MMGRECFKGWGGGGGGGRGGECMPVLSGQPAKSVPCHVMSCESVLFMKCLFVIMMKNGWVGRVGCCPCCSRHYHVTSSTTHSLAHRKKVGVGVSAVTVLVPERAHRKAGAGKHVHQLPTAHTAGEGREEYVRERWERMNREEAACHRQSCHA